MVVLITGFLLRATTFGRYILAAGGNQEAARWREYGSIWSDPPLLLSAD